MHGQKKRRKRTAEGLIEFEGTRLKWELLSEPQKTTEHGYKGLCISVQAEDGRHRELILEYPFPKGANWTGMAFLPQRPKFSEKMIEADVRKAVRAGWEPMSRGKTYMFLVPDVQDQPAPIPQSAMR